jgi:hypothetical protein
MIKTVDHVEHRGLAGPVRPDDGADLTLANIKRDVRDRLHATEGQRHVVHLQHHVAGGEPVVLGMQLDMLDPRVHSAASGIAFDTGSTSACRHLHRGPDHTLAAILECHFGLDVFL